MSQQPRDLEADAEPAIRPLVPEGVLRGIEDIAEGRTVSEAELDEIRKF